MDLAVIKKVAVRSSSRGVLILRKHAPVILTTTGIAGGIVSTVLASKATLKLEETIDGINNALTAAEYSHKSVRTDGTIYTDTDYKRDKAYAYARGSIDIVKLYAPAISIGTASIVCIVSAHGMMQRRNAALTAAYVAVEKGFSEYRRRVEEELGEEKEKKIYFGSESETLTDSDGNAVTVTTIDPNKTSIYARFFDEYSEHWTKIPEYNLVFLRAQQAYFNNKLQARGHVFLNEVYDALGLERSSAGQMVGWVMSKNGDNYIDFGIYREDREDSRAFVNGTERSVLLDFNVDGVIFDKI